MGVLQWIWYIFLFLLVVGLAYLVTRVLASSWQGMQAGRGAKILSQVSLGNRAQLVLVQVAGRVLVLGVTTQQVTLLQTLTGPDAGEILASPGAAGLQGSQFGKLLGRLMGRDTQGDEDPW